MDRIKLINTPLEGLYILEPRMFQDRRGYFFESFNQRDFEKLGLTIEFNQDNQSCSKRGALRGLHFQVNPHEQLKLIRCVSGRAYDVALDLREGSKTFGQWYGCLIEEGTSRQFLIPEGMAHGFQALEDHTVLCYKMRGFYEPEYELGINPLDPELGIDWPIQEGMVLSEKDQNLPGLAKYLEDLSRDGAK